MDYVSLGQIINERGLKGEVKIQSTSSFSALRYKKGNKVLLHNYETKDIKEVTVSSFSKVSHFDYVKFEEINSIEEANKYRGYFVETKIENLPTLDKGFYYYQLINMDVYDQNNNRLGKVSEVFDQPSSTILRVKGEKEFLVPFVNQFIIEVNVKDKKIIINKMEGLI